MGCCLSTNTTSRKVPVSDRPDEAHHFHARSLVPEPEHANRVGKTQNDWDPSLPSPVVVVEEEYVKEVLSETPIWRPQQEHKVMLDENTPLPCNNNHHHHAEAKDVSETCGISESFSLSTTTTATTTTTITEVRDQEDEATSKRKREVGYSTRARLNGSQQAISRRKRPNSGGDVAGRRERGRGRTVSPASRFETTPAAEKRNRIEAGSTRGREAVGQVRIMQRTTVGSTGGVRRDIGEVSSRRSRSPATGRVGGVNQEGLKRSPSKATERAGDKSMGVDVDGGRTKEVLNDAVLQAGNESLENPLVSLECFIFL
ncbi:uncharacterized protein LOC112491310 [Ziziphus jujuba]|uniref:Uncharacterized protein LOC112491310 n=2 Tax=Ziziphus jujuba TaxID=326968 RepID=A0A6P6G311_ZIZJJ|nr:uncharacterized protein LOC112491310 [Ziziphus jujuba]KAH7532921.1 hypothetical protein FEM48_Zijuj04G0073700 [Ziziphus jujuba var. spinosa]